MDLNNKSLQTSSDNSITPEQAKALTRYMPENFIPKIKKITTVKQALEQKTSSLAKIKNNVGVVRTEGLIKVYLVRLNELLDLKKPLSEASINEIASILITDYYTLSMTDIVFVLQQAMKGKYGEMFESLTIPKVIKWFETYFNDRCNTAEEMSICDKSKHNSLFGRERSSGKVNEQREFSKQYTISKMVENHKTSN
jgi:Rad3-related DNA helicase